MTAMARRGAPAAPLSVQLALWVWQRRVLLVFALLLAMVGSALGVVYVTHINRQLYAEMQELQRQQDLLESEYEKLLLEQSAWADYSRVERLTRNELLMKMPDPDEVVVVEY